MKKTIKIVIPLALALAVLTVIGLHPAFIPLKIKPVFLEVSPPLEVYHSEFLHHPEAWNEVFGNVSSIPRFWNSTVNSESAGRSVSEIAAMLEANVYVNDPEYAFCHISVPEEFPRAKPDTDRARIRRQKRSSYALGLSALFRFF